MWHVSKSVIDILCNVSKLFRISENHAGQWIRVLVWAKVSRGRLESYAKRGYYFQVDIYNCCNIAWIERFEEDVSYE